MPNRLAASKSPYLRQHAENPVDWYPWGNEAFERAQAEDRPVLVSIGYSACHWCHVMAHESFENPTVARLMNDHFVNIKVDREERPDVDAVYMEAVQLMTGQGGWPMNVFVTPDRRPFFGGTYFPPAPRQGMPSWPQLLQSIAIAWRDERSRLEQSATSLLDHLIQANEAPPGTKPAGDTAGAQLGAEPPSYTGVLDQAFAAVQGSFDGRNGGFGGAPKFPHPLSLEFLLRTWARTGDENAMTMVRLTLDKMAAGGIHDQLGGGFHRYSVDEGWIVPHFEKMLYDNALLSRLYTLAWQATGSDSYRATAEDILDYVLRDMTSPEGGFYSSEDADSEGEEGRFYVWDRDEVLEILGRKEGEILCRRYGVTPAGNFDGRTILTITESFDRIGDAAGLEAAQVEEAVERGRLKLLATRNRREQPGRDEKILTDWNALMLRALALAGRAFNRPDYLDAARRNACFTLENLFLDGRLLHVYNQGAGDIPAYLEDHAYLMEALTVLFEATGEERWIDSAIELAARVLDDFADPNGGFFSVPAGDDLPVRPRTVVDGVAPSGSSSAAMALLRLAVVTGDQTLVQPAANTIRTVLPALGPHALSFGYMLSALDFHRAPKREVAVVGPAGADATRSLVRTVYSRYLPNAAVVVAEPDDAAKSVLPLLASRAMIENRPTAYVCEGYVCQTPVTDPAALAKQLSP